MKVTFRALTTVVGVELADDLPFRDVVDALLASYPRVDDVPQLQYRLRRGVLSRSDVNDQTVVEASDLAPLFELDLYRQIVQRAAPGWLLHAAAVAVEGGALVFAGPSGAGKTTLALALAARGDRLLTEEIVWIGSDGTVRGLPRALHVRERATLPAGWRTVAYPIRASSVMASQWLIVPEPGALQHEALPLRALVRLTHGPDRTGGLTRLSGGDALLRLWDGVLRQDEAALAAAGALLASVPAYQLASRRFDEALQAVEPLLTLPSCDVDA
ncbi:MAG TPA: hypothetical protein VIW29_02600 [Polyangiaceae bacterium]